MRSVCFLIGCWLVSVGYSANILDTRQVYNPNINACFQVFNGKIMKYNPADDELENAHCKEAKQIFTNWLSSSDCPYYFQDLDTSQFYYQFVENKFYGKNKTGVLVIVPDDKIDSAFYKELGGGLEIPGERCLDSKCSWINNGEIFSFVVNHETSGIEDFKNWRFEKEYEQFNPLHAYYAQLTINYKCPSKQLKETRLVLFVQNNLREPVEVAQHVPILLPKGKVSSLVYYVNGQVKGVFCFDMRMISKQCPMQFESTVYLKDKLGYGRILLAQPRCEGSYPVTVLEKTDLEELVGLDWETIEETGSMTEFSASNY